MEDPPDKSRTSAKMDVLPNDGPRLNSTVPDIRQLVSDKQVGRDTGFAPTTQSRSVPALTIRSYTFHCLISILDGPKAHKIHQCFALHIPYLQLIEVLIDILLPTLDLLIVNILFPSLLLDGHILLVYFPAEVDGLVVVSDLGNLLDIPELRHVLPDLLFSYIFWQILYGDTVIGGEIGALFHLPDHPVGGVFPVKEEDQEHEGVKEVWDHDHPVPGLHFRFVIGLEVVGGVG